MAERLILARHGDPDSDSLGKYLGSTDVALSDLGLRQADALANRMRISPPDYLVVSPMMRTRQTADAMAMPYDIIDSIREVDFGLWEHLPYGDIAKFSTQEDIEKWSTFDMDFTFPDGENLGKFVQRVTTAADDLAAHPASTVMVMAHGGVLRFMITHLIGVPHSSFWSFRIDYASLTTIELSDGFGTLACHNDINHLCDLEGD